MIEWLEVNLWQLILSSVIPTWESWWCSQKLCLGFISCKYRGSLDSFLLLWKRMILGDLFIISLVCVWVYIWVYLCASFACRCSYRPEEGPRFPETGTTGGCEPPDAGAGTELRSSTKAICTPNHWASPPARYLVFERGSHLEPRLAWNSQQSSSLSLSKCWDHTMPFWRPVALLWTLRCILGYDWGQNCGQWWRKKERLMKGSTERRQGAERGASTTVIGLKSGWSPTP